MGSKVLWRGVGFLRLNLVWASGLAFLLWTSPVAWCAEEVRALPVKAQVAGDMQKTRFVAFLSKAVDYRIFPIADPYRIVVDMPETDIQVPGDKGRGLVLSSRSGVLSEGKSRIVIDLAEPALVEKSEILPAANGVPARLVIELARSTFKAFNAASKTPPPIDPKPQTAKAIANPADKRAVIVLDPGHGGVDAGAHGRTSNTPEKEIALDLSLELRQHLESTGRYRVVMTRSTDVSMGLEDRAELAASLKAAILISIHADAVDAKVHGSKGLQGIYGGSIYTLSERASDEQAKAFAQNENKADQKAGLQNVSVTETTSEIDAILSELENRTKKNRSLALQNYLITQMKGKVRLNIKPDRSANLRVLKAAGVPAVLMELGYLSNEEDEKLLISKEWRQKTARHLADAVNSFMAERQVLLPQ